MAAPAWLEWWLSSGHAIDLILAVVAVELVVLVFWLKANGKAWSWAELVGPVFAGIFLMLALRNVLVGGSALVTALWLALSGPAHLYDLVRRVRRWPSR
jgi:RsiW-degrading membrane proteinase PrsW (M82 family)